MGAWSADSKSHVSSMSEGDFYGSEVSTTIENKCEASIVFMDTAGNSTTLKSGLKLEAGEIIDASKMSLKALCEKPLCYLTIQRL